MPKPPSNELSLKHFGNTLGNSWKFSWMISSFMECGQPFTLAKEMSLLVSGSGDQPKP